MAIVEVMKRYCAVRTAAKTPMLYMLNGQSPVGQLQKNSFKANQLCIVFFISIHNAKCISYLVRRHSDVACKTPTNRHLLSFCWTKKKNIEWKYVMLRKDNVELSTTQRQERYLRVVNDPAWTVFVQVTMS